MNIFTLHWTYKPLNPSLKLSWHNHDRKRTTASTSMKNHSNTCQTSSKCTAPAAAEESTLCWILTDLQGAGCWQFTDSEIYSIYISQGDGQHVSILLSPLTVTTQETRVQDWRKMDGLGQKVDNEEKVVSSIAEKIV